MSISSTVPHLKSYPSHGARKELSPSQQINLYLSVSSALSGALAVSPSKLIQDAGALAFIRTYARDGAFQRLQEVIWGAAEGDPSREEKAIRRKTLSLLQNLSKEPKFHLDVTTILDLAIFFARSHPASLRSIFSALESSISAENATAQLLDSFTTLLRQEGQAQGLYGQRKVAECILCWLIAARDAQKLVLPFFDRQFLQAVAETYDAGLTSIASSYGGITPIARLLQNGQGIGSAVEEWQTLWLQTKLALLDSFHIVLSRLVDDLVVLGPGPQLAQHAERAFEVVYGLMEIPPSASSSGTPLAPTPFLNRSLLEDYHSAYNLSAMLSKALAKAEEKDARLDFVEHTFPNSTSGQRDPGALRILFGSGVLLTAQSAGYAKDGKGKASDTRTSTPIPLATSSSAQYQATDNDLDVKATQVLDILPDLDLPYIRALLRHDAYSGDVERVIAALLEGTVPSQDELDQQQHQAVSTGKGKDKVKEAKIVRPVVAERANQFDEELVDIEQIRYGKKKDTGDSILRDRKFIEEMKADILRRAEALSDSEEEADPRFSRGGALIDEEDDDIESVRAVRVAGDGESESSPDSDEDNASDGGAPLSAEEKVTHVVEQAYMLDPKLFERDAQTRRSKERANLLKATGWTHEQLEGWKIMIEKDPKGKQRLLEKNEFRGNVKGLVVQPPSTSQGRGRGRGRGGRGGGGGGGRGGGSGGAGGADDARERAWKDKNKSSQANHNRKRGHDKKMARGGMGAPPQ